MTAEDFKDYSGIEIDNFVIKKLIAVGGMGSVYIGKHKILDKDFAIKILPEQYARNRAFVDRFRREAKRASVLVHENIVPVINFGQIDNTYYLVMPFIEGKNLKELLKSKNLTIRRCVHYARQIAEGLRYAHKRNIIHRDIKPGNVIVTDANIAKITDFGLAKHAIGEEINVTIAGDVLGTPMYMGKEQWLGENVDHRTDIYALGVTLYEILTGKTPFPRKISAGKLAQMKLDKNFVPASSLNQNVDYFLNKIVEKMMEFDPANRYQNIENVIENFDKWFDAYKKNAASSKNQHKIEQKSGNADQNDDATAISLESHKIKRVKPSQILKSQQRKIKSQKNPSTQPVNSITQKKSSNNKPIINLKQKRGSEPKNSLKSQAKKIQYQEYDEQLDIDTYVDPLPPKMYARFFFTVPLCWLIIGFLGLTALFSTVVDKKSVQPIYTELKGYIDAGIDRAEIWGDQIVDYWSSNENENLPLQEKDNE